MMLSLGSLAHKVGGNCTSQVTDSDYCYIQSVFRIQDLPNHIDQFPYIVPFRCMLV